MARTRKDCECGGTGNCHKCNGSGQAPNDGKIIPVSQQETVTCKTCLGAGSCRTCTARRQQTVDYTTI